MKKKIVIGLGIEVISSLIMSLLTWYWGLMPWYIMLSLVVLIVIVDGIVIYRKSYRRIGLVSSSKKRGDSTAFHEALRAAESTVDFLVSWGGSLPGLSNYWQREVSDMVNRGIKFRFLLLRPNSYGSYERRSRSSNWTQNDHIMVLSQLMGIKKERVETGHWEDFRVALYESEACWSMAFVDAKTASIGFYGRGVGRDHPSLEIIRTRSKGLFDFYRKTFEEMWEHAAEINSVHSTEDLNNLLKEDENRKKQGLMFAFVGPCGSGKTTVVDYLVQNNTAAKQLTTYTSREQRSSEEARSQYVFVDKTSFEADDNRFALKTKYCGNEYGITNEQIREWMRSETDYVFDSIFDLNDMRRLFGDRLVLLYLSASSNKTMIDRVRSRFNNDRGQLLLRTEHAKTISAMASLCDYIVYTDQEIDATLSEVVTIMAASRKAYNETGTVVSYFDETKIFRATNQLDSYGLPQDEVSL